MKRSSRRFVQTPTIYEVGEGKDLSEEKYRAAIKMIGAWFTQVRVTKEPELLAKQSLDRCLAGKTAKDLPWFAAANTSLNSRVRAMCRFDLDTLTPILAATESKIKERKRDLATRRGKRLAEKVRAGSLLTDEVRAELKAQGINYGDNVRTLFTAAEERRWRGLKAAYLQEFPHLQSVNAQAELDQLCDLHVMQERIRMDRISGKRAINPLDASTLVDELQKLKKALGIHPDQLKKKVSEKIGDASIGEAANRLESMPDYRRLRARFFLEEILQLWQMFQTPRADGQGYQLDEPGLFALTRCRTCHCGKCGQRNFVGWSVEEIEQVLQDRGLLMEEPNAGTETAPPAGGPVVVGDDVLGGGLD